MSRSERRSKRTGAHDAGLPDAVQQALGGLPAGIQDALEQLPPGFRDQLAQAPPEVLEQLGEVDEGVPVEGLGPDDAGGFDFATATIEGHPDHSFEVRFGRDAYAPGDRVEGVIVARDRVKARELKAELCYVEQSPNYIEQTTHDGPASLGKGAVETGAEFPFALTLPPGALPNWDPGGVTDLLAGSGSVADLLDSALSGSLDSALSGSDAQIAGCGRLYWAVAVTATRRGVVAHHVERHPVPLVDDPAVWLGPEPEAPGEVAATVKGWDVGIDIDPWSPRRGEEVTVTVTVGEPSTGREGLAVGLVGEVHYDVETTSTTTDNDGNTSTSTSRSTRIATAHEEWLALDGEVPHQQVRLRVPDGVPFSYRKGKAKRMLGGTFSSSKGGNAYAVEWKVIAREERRMRRDPRREAPIHVLP